MLGRRGYGNHHCHNKPQTRNGVGVWMTSCPEEMVLRIWGFWKRVSWELGIRLLSRRVKFFGSLPTEMNWDLKHHKMHRVLGMFSTVWIVYLSSCRRNEVKKLINAFVPEQRCPPVFCICKCVCITVVVPIIIVMAMAVQLLPTSCLWVKESIYALELFGHVQVHNFLSLFLNLVLRHISLLPSEKSVEHSPILFNELYKSNLLVSSLSI